MPNLDLIREWRGVQGTEQYAKATPEVRALALDAFIGATLDSGSYSPDDLREFGQGKLDAIRDPKKDKLGFFKSIGEAYQEAESYEDFTRLSLDEQRQSLMEQYARDTVEGKPELNFFGNIVGSLAAPVDEAVQGATAGAVAGGVAGAAGGVTAAPAAAVGAGVGATGGFIGASARQTYAGSLKENFFKLVDSGKNPEEAFNQALGASIRTTGINAVADLINPAAKGATAVARIGKEALVNAGINTGASIADVVQTRASGIEVSAEEARRRIGLEAAGGAVIGAGFQGTRELMGAVARGPRPTPDGVPDPGQSTPPPVGGETVTPGPTPEAPAEAPRAPGVDPTAPEAVTGGVTPEAPTVTTTPEFTNTPEVTVAPEAPLTQPEAPLTQATTSDILAPDAGLSGKQKEQTTAQKLGAMNPELEQARQNDPTIKFYDAQSEDARTQALAGLDDDTLDVLRNSEEVKRKDLQVVVDAERLARAVERRTNATTDEARAVQEESVNQIFKEYTKSASSAGKLLQQAKRALKDPRIFVELAIEQRRKQTGQDIELTPETKNTLVDAATESMGATKVLDELDAEVKRLKQEQDDLDQLDLGLDDTRYMEAGAEDDPTLRISVDKAKKLLGDESEKKARQATKETVEAEAKPIWDQYKDSAAQAIENIFKERKPSTPPPLAKFTSQATRAIVDNIRPEKGKTPRASTAVPTLKDIFNNPGRHREILERARTQISESKLSERAKRKALADIDGLLNSQLLSQSLADPSVQKLIRERIKNLNLPLERLLARGQDDFQLRTMLLKDIREQLGDMDPKIEAKIMPLVSARLDDMVRVLKEKIQAKKVSREVRQKMGLRQQAADLEAAYSKPLGELIEMLTAGSREAIPDDIAALRKTVRDRRRLIAAKVREQLSKFKQAEADAIDKNFRFHKKAAEALGRGFFDTVLMAIQGNFMGPRSIVLNLAGNAVFIPARITRDIVGAQIDALLMSRVGNGTRAVNAPSLSDVAFALRTAWSKGRSESRTILTRGLKPGDMMKGEHMDGFRPVAALAQLVMGVGGRARVLNTVKGTPFERIFADLTDLPTVDGRIPFNIVMAKGLESLGYLPEAIFRTLAATDAFFKAGAEAFELSKQARAAGLRPGTEDFVHFVTHPPDQVLFEARKKAEIATFQERTAFTDTAYKVLEMPEKLFKDYPPLAQFSKFLIRFAAAPFVKTPVNVTTQTLEFFPPIAIGSFAVNLHQVRATLKKMDKLGYQNIHTPEGRKLQDELKRYQAAGARSIGSLVVGVTAWTAFDYLFDKDIVTGGGKKDDKKERQIRDAVQPGYTINMSALRRMLAGDPDTQLRPTDELVNFEKLGAIGTLFAVRGDLLREYRDNPPPEDPTVRALFESFDSLRGAVTFSMESSFLLNAKNLIEAISDGNSERYFVNLAASTANIIVPNTYTQVQTAQLPYKPDVRGGKATGLGEYLENAFKMKLGLGASLPVQIGPWGDPLPQTPEGSDPMIRALIDPFKTQESTKDPKTHILYRIAEKTMSTRVYPSIPGGDTGVITYRGTSVALPTPLLMEYRIAVGHERKRLAERVINSPYFQASTPEIMAERLERVYEKGMDVGKGRFLRQHRDQIEELRTKELLKEAAKRATGGD